MARIWMPNYPPASADDKDDEFSDESLDGKWGEWDVATNITVSEQAYGLSLVQTATNGDRWGGVYQAVPASGDWAIWTKMSLSAAWASGAYPQCAIFVAEDVVNNPTTADLLTLALNYRNAATFEVSFNYWSAYNAFSGGAGYVPDAFIATSIYARIRKSGTTYYGDVSTDGIGWMQIGSKSSYSTVAYFGLGINNFHSSAVTARAVFQFFRCVDGTPALTDVMNGRRVM